jgi:uncharacterized protein YdhG (YjbR/CyaY superfamily)
VHTKDTEKGEALAAEVRAQVTSAAKEAAEKVAYFRGRFSPWSFFSG